MKITYLNSASILIQDDNVKVLCDPWLDGEEYFGSWGIYPPYDFKPQSFDDVDFIYISHIHPDHCSSITMSKLKKNIPVVIHNFPEKYLKNKIENLGFTVIELEHNLRVRLKNKLYLNILAADNCNPEICGKVMGCAFLETKFGTTQIDTMSVIDNGNEVIVNTNDCPYQIAQNTARQVKRQYPNIDMLLVGYVKASSYPQTFDLDNEQKTKEAQIKQQNKLETAKNYIEILKPKYFMPFAGRYTLVGKNYHLNQYRGEPELEFAYDWLCQNIPQNKHKAIILNQNSYFNILSGKSSEKYNRIDLKKKQKYIENVLSKKNYHYENEPDPSIDELLKFIPKSYKNFERQRKKIGWISDTTILLRLSEEVLLAISCNGEGFKKTSNDAIKNYKKYLMMSVDRRLLKWLLQGPIKAQWGIVDIGCHIRFKRVPNLYERALYNCWNYFYSNSYS